MLTASKMTEIYDLKIVNRDVKLLSCIHLLCKAQNYFKTWQNIEKELYFGGYFYLFFTCSLCVKFMDLCEMTQETCTKISSLCGTASDKD